MRVWGLGVVAFVLLLLVLVVIALNLLNTRSQIQHCKGGRLRKSCRSVKTAQMVMAQRLEGSKFVFPVSYLREKAAPTELVRITCSINIRLELSVRRTSASKVESVKTSGLIVPWRVHWSAYLGERSTCSGCRVKTMDLKSQSSSLWHSNCANMGNDP